MKLKKAIKDAITALQDISDSLEDLCYRIDDIISQFKEWEVSKSDDELIEILNKLEKLKNDW